MFRRAQVENKIIGYYNILTPIKDYWNVKFDADDINTVSKGLQRLCKNETKERYVLRFIHEGKEVVIMPETLKNSVIEYTIYKKKWWGLLKIK